MDGLLKLSKDDLDKVKLRDVQKGNLVPYYLGGLNNPQLFNGIQVVPVKKGQKTTATDFKITGLPKDVMTQVPDEMIKKYIAAFRKERVDNGAEAFWKMLMKDGDRYSVRQYLTLK